MEPDEVFKYPPVYRYDQILTKDDLITFYENLKAVYDVTPVIYMLERDRLAIALKTVDTLITWIEQGKNPEMFIQL